jgi:hypothetical protein
MNQRTTVPINEVAGIAPGCNPKPPLRSRISLTKTRPNRETLTAAWPYDAPETTCGD